MTSIPDDENDLGLSFADATDIGILMHRDVHFGGQFESMLEYYNKYGKGINPDFELTRISALDEIEKRIKQNLAPLLLSGADAEKVARAKEAYKKLRSVYEQKKPSSSSKPNFPLLIANLILSEEESPEEEIAAIVAQKGAIVPALIDLLRSEDYSDPLFPGYGLAPNLAVKCLGLIGDKRAIIALFETIGEGDFFSEDMALDALKAIGAPAKEFLLRVLHGQPITYDNERAAIALSRFRNDPEVAMRCLEMLKTLDLKKHFLLADYLVLVCEGLSNPEERKEFHRLAELATTPPALQRDIQAMVKEWNK